MSNLKRSLICLSAMLLTPLAIEAIAQVPQAKPNQPARGAAPVAENSERRTALRPTQPSEAMELNDQQIAAMLLIDAQGEVDMGQFAESRASSEQAKKLARHLIEDHSKTVSVLKPLAGPLAAVAMSKETDRQPELSGGLNMVAIKKQIADECADWQQKELSKKQGAEFDQCFANGQLLKHMEVICAEKVLRRYVSGDLQQAIDEDLKAAEHHLKMARDLVEKQADSKDAEK
jgi:predicted outer membrane protein